MRFLKRALLPIALASLVPTLAFATVAIYFAYRDERANIENEATARARAVMTSVDAQVNADLSALTVLATSPFIDARDWTTYDKRVRRVVALNPHWQALRLADVDADKVLVDTTRDFGAPLPADDIDNMRAAAAGKTPFFRMRARPDAPGGAPAARLPTVHLYVPVIQGDTSRYVLALTISPRVYQNILIARTTPDSTTAVVDREGLFIARNVDFEARAGTPATHFVREAVAGGASEGFYRGTTYEGFENYTAFFRSSLTGWSAHIAVASTLIDRPRSLSLLSIGLAMVASLALGAMLVFIVAKDFADRQRTEDKLRQAQKMEAVGRLTGGIAHDFNNLLTAIIGNLELLSLRLGNEEKLKRRADNALDAAQRAAKLTAGLLAFSRMRSIELTTVDLGELIAGLRELIVHSAGPQVAVQIDIDGCAQTVMGDPGQIEMALINLAVNARDAMADGGTLTLSTHPFVPGKRDALAAGAYVELRIADTGCGMSEETRLRALEPFFTTKPAGHGTGLGLAQASGMVRQSGGDLRIDSAPGAGTRVSLILPAAAPGAIQKQSAELTPSGSSAAPHATARVLVVEDEAAIRTLICETLETLGHRCACAADGEEALASLAESPFDLLVTDYALPRMNGAELARKAHALQGDLKVLFVTGYADLDEIERAVTGVPVLRKPFGAHTLEGEIARLLQRQAGAPEAT